MGFKSDNVKNANGSFNPSKGFKEGTEFERQFLSMTPYLNHLGGIRYKMDFTDGDSTTIELKSEKYYFTGNFFFERYSDMEKETIGGPWRALRDNVDKYFNWFPTDPLVKRLFVLNPAELVKYLESEHRTLTPVSNETDDGKCYKSGGYIVSILDVEKANIGMQTLVYDDIEKDWILQE